MKSINNTLDFTGNTITGLVPNNIPVTSISAVYSSLITDKTIVCTTNTFVVTLYTAVGNDGGEITINNQGTGVITIDGDGTETINGALNQTLNQYDSRTLRSNGTNWIIIASN